ncbi:hypothetical protein KR032_000150, partial [Drosophila birchii]
MNPACRLNLDSPECQTWMNAVSSHCRSLLPFGEQASLWDSWWPDELPAPYKTWVSTMSAFDCYRVRKEVANQVDGRFQAESKGNPSLWTFCRWTMVFLVLFTVLIAVVFALRMVIESCRRKRSDESSKCPSTPEDLKPICVDVESPPCDPPFKKPKSVVSFGPRLDPIMSYGSYGYQKLVKTSSMPDYKTRAQE